MALTAPDISIPAEHIENHYNKLNQIGAAEQGFHRPAYSDAETAAMIYIEQVALAGRLLCRWDAVGNLVIETPGEYEWWVETGSHMDTVPAGGNYDGTAGVVAGLEAILAIHGGKPELPFGLRLRIWRGEESAAFGITSIGAQAAFGALNPKLLQSNFQGRSLEQAMDSQHADPDYIRSATPTISMAEKDGISAYIELHIEQGKVLENKQRDIGIVTGIRGSLRRWVRFSGVFDHSGATPMGAEYRKDVNLAMAHAMVRLDKLATDAIAEGHDIVQTIGVINSSPDQNEEFPAIYRNAVSKVSGFGYFSHEVRSCSAVQAKAFARQADALIRQVAEQFGVNVEIKQFSASDGIPELSSDLQKLLAESCRLQDASFTHLPSGAWHDAAVLCSQQKTDGGAIPVGMLFIPCRAGISHSPEEYSSPAQIALGASVLAQAMLLAGKGNRA
jgi:N-carbamoyl-L-amino-acid hydrolase